MKLMGGGSSNLVFWAWVYLQVSAQYHATVKLYSLNCYLKASAIKVMSCNNSDLSDQHCLLI